MASKRGRVSRGSSSRAAPTPSALTFPNLNFLYDVHAEKFLKIMDYHIMKEKAFDLNDLRGLLIADNIKYMANAAQKAYGHLCVINELCRRAGVLVYPDDEMINTKAMLNASTIRRSSPVFRYFYEQQEDHMLTQSLKARFASTEEMENHLTNQDQEKTKRKFHMHIEWTRQNNEFNNTMHDMHDLFRNNNMEKSNSYH
ncbi:hypothetical protein KIW84_014171 [Lathyrus oleraceus]|uniref:Uncharacterized protein n=1 Tax=Pisum sativum TaxID=3888 RepID=A0A9D5BMD7_PEA|nr:hypothetical protein KIW84_014171 [Pisum sativum]